MLKKLFFVLPILLVLLACSKTAFTGRKQHATRQCCRAAAAVLKFATGVERFAGVA
jgi:hypothetical protein